MRSSPRAERRRGFALAVSAVMTLCSSGCLDDPGTHHAAPRATVHAAAQTRAGTPTTASTPSTTTEAAARSTTAGVLTDDQLLDRVRRSVVRIRNTSCTSVSVGSGFTLTPGEIITNRHVAEKADRLELLSWDGHDLSVGSAAVSTGADIARLGVVGDAAAALQPIEVRTTRVTPGERIAVVGFPEAQELAITTGVAVGYGPGTDGDSTTVLQATTVVHHGNSGGPALDDHGRLVGVVYAIHTADDLALIIPIDEALALTPSTFHPSPSDCRLPG